MQSPCLFCSIAKKEVPATVVFEDAAVIAFDDIRPQAPVHVVIIPKEHVEKLSDLTDKDLPVIGTLFLTAKMIAGKKGIDGTGYRVVINCGRDAGQAVQHLHLHLLGGRPMRWPPG